MTEVGGPVVIGYDGSPASKRALAQSADLLGRRRVLVVVVWEPGQPLPMMDPGLSLAPLDMRSTLEIDQASSERAQRLAEDGAAMARGMGLEAEGLAVADELTVADTLLRLARERRAPAIVVGAHGHSRVRELFTGSTTRDVVRHAECPVVVVRDADES